MDVKKSFPKVLIIGETFRFTGGGGITLINLFKDWFSENIAIATEKIHETTFESNCRKFYRLGQSEIKFIFPFNLINKVGLSGEVELKISRKSSFIQEYNKRNAISSIKYELEKAYYLLLVSLGLCNSNYQIKVSDQLLKWIEEYSPDIIYAQPFRYRDMVFALELKRKTGILLAIHIMDDSVNFSNKPNLLHTFWRIKINKTFKQLVEAADIHLCISQAMSDEYLKRYNRHFTPFRNPIDIQAWSPYFKSDWTIKGETNIIYTGRLAEPNINALYTFCIVVDQLNHSGYQVKLHIYSIDINPEFTLKTNNFNSIVIHDSVSFEQIPALIPKFDIAFLPIDFTKNGIKYAKYSISTKTSEYMISGVPILLFAPEQVALTTYARLNGCMYSVSKNETNLLSDALENMINNSNLRESLAKKAQEVAKFDSDALSVREQFREILKGEK